LTGAGESYNVKFMLTDFDIGQAGVGEVWEVIWNGVTVAEVSNAGAVTSPISGISGSSVSLGDIDNSGTLNTMRDYTISGLITDATGNNTLTLQQKTGAANARDLDYVRIEGTGASVGGNDILNGGTGIDRIFGGEGNDTLTGGAGADRFVYSQMINNGADTITDFLVGTDKIILADLLPLNNLAAQSMSSVASPDIVVGDLINSVATTGHITMNQTVTWTDATHTLTMAGTGSSITFTGMTVSYANATLFLNANAILTGDSFNSVI
jgi:Ca2+-binding RTX toxin-like protein